MALQHLRSSTANKRPTPGVMSDGQLAMNTNLASPGLFLKDSNGDLVKVGPVHVGTTAPNVSPAAGGQAGNSVGEQWLDTSSSRYVFKIWDGTAWRTEDGEFVNISGDTMTGALGIIAGTAAAPGVFFSGDTNTGIYSPGADQLAVATNGVERVEFGTSEVVFNDGGADYDFRIEGDTNANLFFVDASTDRVGIGTTSPAQLLHLSSSSNPKIYIERPGQDAVELGIDAGVAPYVGCGTDLSFRTGGTSSANERARIDSSGRLLVGTSSARSNFFNGTSAPLFQVANTGSGSAIEASFIRATNDLYGGELILGKTRGTTVTSNTIIQSGDTIGSLSFQGADGTNFQQAALIVAQVDGTPGANDMPGRLVFSTTADGATNPTERMRIDSQGILNCFSNSGVGFNFRHAGQTSETNNGISLFSGSTNNSNGTRTFTVLNSGNVQNANNSYGSLSDAKLKENIVDAATQWADIKALQVRNYNLKEETGQSTHTQIGLVAQEVELVSPGLVTESPDCDADGNDLGTVTKSVNYSVLYMKAVKALQEAMERIEQLEQRLTDAGIT